VVSWTESYLKVRFRRFLHVAPVKGYTTDESFFRIRCIIANDPDGEWKYARYFDPTGVEPEQYEMYHLRDGAGQPVDPNELENLAHEGNVKARLQPYVDKRAELAQRLAALEAERLQPLAYTYLPLVQKS